jgi:glucose uptake protein GlcU
VPEGVDKFWAIASVGEAGYCPPTTASRLASGAVCCVLLLRPRCNLMQITVVCLAIAIVGTYGPTYEDVKALRTLADNRLAEHRAGIESKDRH